MPHSNRQEQQADKKARYLAAVAEVGTLTGGCAAAHVGPHTVYAWRERDETFTLAEREARSAFADSLEHEAVKRARDHSDVLLIFLLKAARPEKYRERISVASDPAVERVAAELGLQAKDVLAEVQRLANGSR